MSQMFTIGDVIHIPNRGVFLVMNSSMSNYCLVSTKPGVGVFYPEISDVDYLYNTELLATKQYTGPLTQEEIDELLKQLQNKVDEVSQMEFDFSNDDDDCYPPVINNWYTEDEVVSCSHTWKQVVLLNSTVYDCSKCGAKKESV